MFRATMCHHQENLLYLCDTGIFHCWWLSGLLCAHHQENLLCLCDGGIFRSVWVAVWSAMLSASGELTVSLRRWYFSFCMGGCLVCYVPIIRRTYCVFATVVFFVLCGWLSGLLCYQLQQNLLCLCDGGIFRSVWVAVWSAMFSASGELTVSLRRWYFSFCMGGCLVCRPDSNPYSKFS